MKFQFKRRPAQPEPEDKDESLDLPARPVENVSIDISLPRECIYQAFSKTPGPCPRCGGQLYQSKQTFMIATKSGNRIGDSFMTNVDMGWFCLQCPTVVINTQELSKMFQVQLPHWKVGSDLIVLGIVDLEAVPEEKEHIPLGDPGNPIPLVQFTNSTGGATRKPTPTSHKRRPKAKTRRK